MNYLEIASCCGVTLDSIILIPSAFGKPDDAKSSFVESLSFGESGKSVSSPFFLYFSHTPQKPEVKEILASLVRVFAERGMPVFGGQKSYDLLTGVPSEEEEDGTEGEIVEAYEFLEEDELKEIFVSQLTPDRQGVTMEGLSRNLGLELKMGFDREDDLDVKKGIPSARHLDINSYTDLQNYVRLLKEATHYDLPIFVSIRGDSVFDVCSEALEGRADGFILRTDNPIAELPGVIDAFAGVEGKKKGIKLFVVTSIRNAGDILKLRALGADAVGFDICELVQKVKTEDGLRDFLSGLEADIKKELLYHGARNLAELNENWLRALDHNTAAVSGLKLIGYDRKLPMWRH